MKSWVKAVWASLGLCLPVSGCVWRDADGTRCVLLVSTWGSHITSALHPDSGGGEGLAGSERRRRPAGSGVMVLRVPSLPVGGEELGRMERMEGSRGNAVTKGVLGKWPNTAAWT